MNESRRKFLKRVAYVTPVILTAAVRPAYACSAYGGRDKPKPQDHQRRQGPSRGRSAWWNW